MVVPIKRAMTSPGPVLVSSPLSLELEDELLGELELLEFEELPPDEPEPVLRLDGDCSELGLWLPELFEELELPDVSPAL
jgi:hypothetical protein